MGCGTHRHRGCCCTSSHPQHLRGTQHLQSLSGCFCFQGCFIALGAEAQHPGPAPSRRGEQLHAVLQAMVGRNLLWGCMGGVVHGLLVGHFSSDYNRFYFSTTNLEPAWPATDNLVVFNCADTTSAISE